MAGMRGKRLRAGAGSLRVSGLGGVIGRNRSPLLACTALTAFMAAGLLSPVSVQEAAAANECTNGNNPSGSPATVSCGGPYNSGIVYGNTQTNPANGIIFNFDNTQVTGPGSGNNRSAVQLSTNKASNSFDINIDQVGNGAAPSFQGANVSFGNIFDVASKTSNGFQVSTSASGASITFDVNQEFDLDGINGSGASFTGGNATSWGIGNASASGIAFATSGANSGVTINLANVDAQGGTATALGLGTGTAHGFGLSTSGTNSGIVFNATNSSFDGGTANGLAGTAAGVSLATRGNNGGVTVNLTEVEIEGGNVLAGAGAAHGFNVSTEGNNSGVEFTLEGGSIEGGSVNALLGEAHGVNIETEGQSSGVTFDLVEGEISGGTGISLGHGVNISTANTGSDIEFDTAEGTSITSSSGHGVNLYTDGSDILADGTINGLVESTWVIAGVGVGTGFNAEADGDGNVFAHVGETGIVRGTGAGLVGQASGTGDVTLDIDGVVSQTSDTATSGVAAFGLLPVGVGGVAYGSGDVTITAIEGSNISQVGSTPLVEVKGVGMFAVNAGTGNATATADGILSATGIGAASLAGSGNATTNVGGSITVGGGTGVSPLGALTFGVFDETIGALAVSGTGAAQVNIFGGDINGAALLGGSPGIGGMALVLGGVEDAGVDVGDGIEQASIINAESLGLAAVNFGSGDANIDISALDPEGDHNVVNSGGIGLMALALGGGDADVEARNSVINSDGIGILAVGNNVWIDANDVTSQNGGGIVAFGGNVDIDIHGDVRAEGDFLSAGVSGISLGDFSVEVASGASIATDGGLWGDAINAASGTGITVINDGTITGTMTLFSLAGDNYVENNSNNSWNWAGFNTFVTLGGDNILENNGTSNAGPFSLTTFISSGDSIINNNFGATFNTDGFNAFAFATGGTSEFNNAGTFNVNGFAGFFGLEDFNNSGTVDMSDGAPFDIVATTGNFTGTGNSTLSIDAALTPNGFADLLIVGGDVGGVTSLTVQDLVGGPGQYTGNDDAILFALVGGNTDTTNFTTNGGIEKGFFTYDAYLRDTPFNPFGLEEWVLASAQNYRSFELPVIAYGAQQMWHTSTGTWNDRTADLRSAFGGTGFGGGGADIPVEPIAPVEAASVTPGIWGRLFGGTQSRDHSNTVSAPTGLSGPQTTYNNNFDQDIYGGMVGIDFGQESLTDQGNQAWIFGVMAGYTGSNLSFDDSNTDVDYKAGSIGAYVTYLNGGFFIDATIKADFGKMDYNSGGDSGSADFTSVGGVIDAGYRMTMASGWYFEPKATLSYVNTDFDDLDVLGQEIAFKDGDSLRGRLGGRVGTAFDRNGVSIEPYIEASVWNEFKGDYTAAFTSNGTDFTPGFNAEGVYGEVALGASFINTANGWSGFAKGATQFGEDSMLGFTGNLGVRKAW